MNEIVARITATFETVTGEDGYFALGLAELLASTHLPRGKEADIGRTLESLARSSETNVDLHGAREIFAASAKWFRKANDVSKVAEMTVLVAEEWVKEAVARMSSAQPSSMIAASFYEKAIQTYRSIPRRERTAYEVDGRIAELHKHMTQAGERSLSEMSEIRSPTMDITQLVESSREAVRGKPTIEALATFASIHRGAQVARMRETSEKMLRSHPLQALFSATHVSRDGRVIARRPGMGLSDAASADTQAAIWAEMIKDYGMEVGLVVQGSILPALDVLVLEHRLREADFVAIASRSAIVPTGRERLFAKALFSGYERDVVAALHLLVPQIEHMVRWHLKSAGVKTTTLDAGGIENENGLSALMELPEATSIFGENLAFELKALFCDAFGANLRNEVAHGLLDDEACYSASAVYAWWFAFSLVYKEFWNAGRAAGSEKADDGA